MRLDHIAYRVRDRKEAAQFLEETLGYKIDPSLEEGFDIQFEDGTQAKCLVLLPPESESTSGAYFVNGYLGSEWHAPPEIFVSDGNHSSIVAEWVEENGPGIHHLAYQVDCVKTTMDEWKLKGVAFLSEEPMHCDGLVQVFTKPSPSTGIIYELIERESVGFCRDNVKQLMQSENNKVWLYLDQALRKLQNITHWTTSADPWHEDIKEARRLVEAALKKLENDK